MIRLKLVAFGKDFSDFDIVDGENLEEAVKRCTEKIPLGDRTIPEVFQVLVNGHTIDSGFWAITKIRDSDTVLIAPLIKGDDPSAIFRGVLQIVITAAAYYFLGPAGAGLQAGSFGLGLATGAASIVGTLVLNALIPPPVPNASPLAGTTELAQSQMYSLSGQSNQPKQYGLVPKVYGQHRMFPPIAANPYIEIETDPGNPGKFIQYLYAIYDFGLGPQYVSGLKIGDTPIENYPDLELFFVDPNKPATNEGPWDDQCRSSFNLYKGDNEFESLSISLDGNQNTVPQDPQDTWETIRSAPTNPQNLQQTITISMVCPRGLFGSAPSGAFSKRNIELEIYFARQSDPDSPGPHWLPANGDDFVSYYSEDGGFDQYQQTFLSLAPFSVAIAYYQNLNPAGEDILLTATTEEINGATLPPKTGKSFWAKKNDWGFKAGTIPTLALLFDPEIIVGSVLRTTIVPKPPQGVIQKITAIPPTQVVGKVVAISQIGSGPYFAYVMDRPVTSNVIVQQKYAGTLNSAPARSIVRFTDSESSILSDKTVVGKGKISRDSVDPQYSTFKFTPRAIGEYKVRITRVSTVSQFTTQVSDALSVIGIATRFAGNAIATKKRHTFLEIKVRATGQLNGVIQNLSGVVTSALQVWTGSAWERQLTNNPAWVFTDLMTGQVNKRPLDLAKLHTTSLLEWAQFADAIPDSGTTGMGFVRSRFGSNFILDYSTTLQDVLNQVANAAQASINIIDGKYGVLLDVQRIVPVQIFTPRNSSNFSSTRSYPTPPQATKIKYIDSGNDWLQAETVLYEDGFNFGNTDLFDEITAFGCTNHEQAWRFGRYMLAQHKLRQETMSLQVDFEYLVCTRGDYVQITQDVMKVGGYPARVRTRVSNRVTIDDAIETLPISYGFLYRSSTGEIKTNTLTIVDARTFDLDGSDFPEPGDLIIIGEVGFVAFNCIVKSITPNADHTATLVLVEKADAIYEAESTSDFPDYDPQINPATNQEFKPPGEVQNLAVLDNDYIVVGRSYQNFIDLDWDAPTGSAFEFFEIYVNYGDGYNRTATTRESFYKYIVDPKNLDKEHSFKVIAVSAGGLKKNLIDVGDVTATPETKMTLPSDITQFSSDITGEVLQLLWGKLTDIDISEYRIRYSPETDGTVSWSQSVPLLIKDVNVTQASVQARTGTYLIKAVDFNGNESATPGAIVTTIPTLFGLNIIDTINDFPDLEGTKNLVEILEDSLVLQQEIPGDADNRKYYTAGYYYFKTTVDLMDIYSVRLQAKIVAVGFTIEDVMSNWENLIDVHLLQHARSADWDAEIQYRSTNQFNVMEDWSTLTEVESLDSGSAAVWTPWRKFTIGDATGRRFQFRLKLTSLKPSVTPRVFEATVQIDTPDRIESYNNLVAPDTGFEQSYAPPFLGPTPSPNVQITLENGQAGDYWVFEFKTLDAFKIHFFNSSNVEVSRQFDAVAKGFGRKANAVI